MFVVGRLHVAAQLVRGGPEFRLESKIGPVVVRLLCHGFPAQKFPTQPKFT